MKLTEIPAPDFDLAKTLDSGQVFHWEKIDNGFYGTIGDRPVYAEQRGDSLRVTKGCADLICNYFALDHPLAKICASFPNDPLMHAARNSVAACELFGSQRWECLATFICSSMKQVAHIRQISQALRRRFGEQRKIDADELYTFPSAERIAGRSEKELRECALGYRAKNLLATAELVSSGEANLEAWVVLSDADLRAKLCALPGVGAKVANCVMLFAYERLRAFPIDVWIERVLRGKYFPRARKLTGPRLRAFSETYFGEHGGYAQQYLFHHARRTNRPERKRGRNLSAPRR